MKPIKKNFLMLQAPVCCFRGEVKLLLNKQNHVIFHVIKTIIIIAIMVLTGLEAFADTVTLKPPEVNVKPGEVLVGTKIKFDSIYHGSVIYYTTDGTEPDESSPVLDEHIYITGDTTIKYFMKTVTARTETMTISYTVRQPEIILIEDLERIYYLPVRHKRLFFPDEPITRYETVNCLGVLFSIEPTEIEYGFTDVKEPFRCIDILVSAGVLSGYPDNTFRGENGITRAEFVKILHFMLRLPDKGNAEFSDIIGHWAEEYIKAFSVHGYINGYPDGTFRPDNMITRAEAVTILNKISGKVNHKLNKMADFDDVEKTHWAYEDIYKAAFYSARDDF